MKTYDLDFFARPGEKIYINKSIWISDELPEHTHKFFEIAYVCRGSGVHIIGGTKIPAHKGDIYFLGYNTVHTFEPVTHDFMWMNCCFLPEVISDDLYDSQDSDDILKFALFGNLFSHQKVSLSDIQLTDMINEFDTIFNEMFAEYSRAATGYQEMLKYYLNIVLIKILRSAKLSAQSLSVKDRALGSYANEDIVHMVLENINESFSTEGVKLKDLAEKAYMSPKYFSNLFKKKTGQSLTDFLHTIKINKACSMLENTNMNVAEIMEYIGYRDTKFFYSLFHKKTGLTPGQYRKEYSSLSHE